MHSCILDLGFGFFKIFGVFEFFMKFFGLGFVKLLLYGHVLHILYIITMFHAFVRYVLD